MDCFLSEVLEAGFSMAFLLKINQGVEEEGKKEEERGRSRAWATEDREPVAATEDRHVGDRVQ